VGPIALRFEVDHSNPSIDEARVLPGADVLTGTTAARKQPVIVTLTADAQPSSDRVTRGFGDLKRYRPPCLLLNYDRALANGAPGSYIADAELYKVTSAELGV
jgi:hypothetical protein